jgi:hypothetical protein
VLLQFRAVDTEDKCSLRMALPDTGTSRTIILRHLLDKAKIKYNTGVKEPIVTANSSPLGCVGNVLLDIQIDRGKHLTIDALVVDNLSSNCLIAWKDMQRAGIISPSFPAKVHLTKVAPAVVGCRVDVMNMPLCALPNVEAKRVNVTDMPKCSVPSKKCVNMTNKSDSLVISPNMIKRTVMASAVDQSKGSCLKQNLTNDTVESLMKEFKDVFEADKITPLAGAPMQIHLKQDDPSYRPIRVSHHRKVPLHFQEKAD